ncbi:MAG: phage Gp37/Gp68 family protein [Bacillota bacterium]
MKDGQYWDVSWNPVTGCTPDFDCWERCWARLMARRFGDKAFRPTCHPERLDQPLHWHKPRTIFVALTGDLFNEAIPDRFIDRVFAVMALCPQHTFLVLTKRAERMMHYFQPIGGTTRYDWVFCAVGRQLNRSTIRGFNWPLPNVVLMTSISTQEDAEKRLPFLLRTPAAMRGVSVEPMLEAIDLTNVCVSRTVEGEDFINALYLEDWTPEEAREAFGDGYLPPLDWVICGGEAGPGARPCHPDWIRGLRDQAKAAGVPFYFKQWGEWVTEGQSPEDIVLPGWSWCPWAEKDEDGEYTRGDQTAVYKVGKRAAGRLLDGAEYSEMPALAGDRS